MPRSRERLRIDVLDIVLVHSSGEDRRILSETDVVVVSSAVQPDNPEVLEARRLKIPVIRRAEENVGFQLAPMIDMTFLLLIFFMVTTIFKLEQGLAITLPRSTAGEKITREKVAHIWIDHRGTLSIDDLVIGVPDIEPLILAKIRENPGLIVSFNTDDQAPYQVVNEAMDRLKLAYALRVSFTTMPEEG